MSNEYLHMVVIVAFGTIAELVFASGVESDQSLLASFVSTCLLMAGAKIGRDVLG